MIPGELFSDKHDVLGAYTDNSEVLELDSVQLENKNCGNPYLMYLHHFSILL